jgi:DNA-binding transcriptional LysR family regulator
MAKAAGQLGISQPSISEIIANLEGALGVRLLDRSPRGIQPTIYATALLKRGLVIFDELRQGIREIHALADPTVGEVRIGCPETLTAGFLPAIIDRMSRGHPQIAFHVVHADSATTEFRELRERHVDLMLGRIMEPGLTLDDELHAEILFKEQYLVVAGTESPWARRRKVDLADLMDQPWIHMPSNNPLSSLLAEAFHAQGLEVPRTSVSCFSMHLRMHLLATGRYLTIIPNSMLRFSANRWSIKALPIDLGIKRRLGAVITLKHRTLGPTAQLFIDHARQVAKSMTKEPEPQHRVRPGSL